MDPQRSVIEVLDLLDTVEYLTEAKSFTKHAGLHKPSTRDLVGKYVASISPEYLQRVKRQDAKRALEDYKVVEADFTETLGRLLRKFRYGDETRAKFQRDAKGLFREMYRRAFSLGLQAGGVRGYVASMKKDEPPPLTAKDREWLERTLTDESKYFNKFVDDVAAERVGRGSKMNMADRTKLYGNSLRMAFESGRVMATPGNALIYWIMNPKAEHCQTCQWLLKMSPFSKQNIPTLLKEARTACVIGCKCRLLVRFVSDEKFKAFSEKAPTRAQLLAGMKAHGGK